MNKTAFNAVVLASDSYIDRILAEYSMSAAYEAGASDVRIIAKTDDLPLNGIVIALRADMPFITPDTIRTVMQSIYRPNNDDTDKIKCIVNDVNMPDNIQENAPNSDSCGEMFIHVEDYASYMKHPDELQTIINPMQFAKAIKKLKKQINLRHMERGVILTDAATTYIGPRVKIGAGSVIAPNTTLEGVTVVGDSCMIGPNTVLTDTLVKKGASIINSVARESEIGEEAKVGPFAYLRPGAVIGKRVKVGDFVEIKNAVIGDDTKISHLTYVGDADVGKHVNFGCGSVTVNYDGTHKHRTIVEDGAFIGCNTNLVAPVTIGSGAYTAAGSTVTINVPANDLAVARSRQKNIAGWVLKKHGKIGE